MSWTQTVLLLLTTYVVLFLQTWLQLLPALIGFRPDLLPVIVLFAALRSDLATAVIVAAVGGLWFDSLSMNPFGISILPLAAVALGAHAFRSVLAFEETWIQFLIGMTISATVPLITLILLFTAGEAPLLGPWFFWRWTAGALLGGACTPLFFGFFGRIYRSFSYQPEPSISFRPDREIARGRDPHAHR